MKYPTEFAPRGDVKHEYPTAGGNYTAVVNDPYNFLEDPDAEATKAWVGEQNKLTEKVLATCPTRDSVKAYEAVIAVFAT